MYLCNKVVIVSLCHVKNQHQLLLYSELCGGLQNGLIESMEVTKGKKHSRRFHKGGWEGYITFAKGFSTIHFRSVAPDFDRNLWPVFGHGMVPFMSSEPAEDVRMVMDAVTKAAIREQN